MFKEQDYEEKPPLTKAFARKLSCSLCYKFFTIKHIFQLRNYGCIFDVSNQIFIALIIQIMRYFISFLEKKISEIKRQSAERGIQYLVYCQQKSHYPVGSIQQGAGEMHACCKRPQVSKNHYSTVATLCSK